MYSLFALSKLSPTDAHDENFWAVVEDLVCRYAAFTPEESARYGARVQQLSVRSSGGRFQRRRVSRWWVREHVERSLQKRDL
jgi:hypothetical protein